MIGVGDDAKNVQANQGLRNRGEPHAADMVQSVARAMAVEALSLATILGIPC